MYAFFSINLVRKKILESWCVSELWIPRDFNEDDFMQSHGAASSVSLLPRTTVGGSWRTIRPCQCNHEHSLPFTSQMEIRGEGSKYGRVDQLEGVHRAVSVLEGKTSTCSLVEVWTVSPAPDQITLTGWDRDLVWLRVLDYTTRYCKSDYRSFHNDCFPLSHYSFRLSGRRKLRINT